MEKLREGASAVGDGGEKHARGRAGCSCRPRRGSIPERNMGASYAAFDVKEGDRQYIAPEQRVRIWY